MRHINRIHWSSISNWNPLQITIELMFYIGQSRSVSYSMIFRREQKKKNEARCEHPKASSCQALRASKWMRTVCYQNIYSLNVIGDTVVIQPMKQKPHITKYEMNHMGVVKCSKPNSRKKPKIIFFFLLSIDCIFTNNSVCNNEMKWTAFEFHIRNESPTNTGCDCAVNATHIKTATTVL